MKRVDQKLPKIIDNLKRPQPLRFLAALRSNDGAIAEGLNQ